MKKILKWGAIGIVVIIIIGAFAGSGDKTSNPTGSTPTTAKEEEKIYQVGETIVADKVEVVTVGVSEKNQVGGQYLNEKASEGATLLAVNWKYKNVSDKPIGSFSQPSIKLIDSNGTEYSWDLGKSSTYATEQKIDSKVLSDLNPGITVNDARVFEISKEAYAKGGWKLKVTVSGKSYLVQI